MVWKQLEINLPAHGRGCHLLTKVLEQHIRADLAAITVGLCHVFIKHTSASLTVNENADPDVRRDMEAFFSHAVPEGASAGRLWEHTDEGPDDMPAHVKASLMGPSVTLPISGGRLNLGTWQGVWLCEHRNAGGPRRLVVTLQGE